MQSLRAVVIRFVRRSDGQDLLEYGLLASLIAMVAFGAVQLLGNTIYNLFWAKVAQIF
ncbi:MAG TPA: Flp family type IVb pilin [Vicinamibacterales bacterium]|nr:Flp family type IVb pilin [Vicinamibacterales bacterium]